MSAGLAGLLSSVGSAEQHAETKDEAHGRLDRPLDSSDVDEPGPRRGSDLEHGEVLV